MEVVAAGGATAVLEGIVVVAADVAILATDES